jgi:hypothetical protein
MYEQKYNQYKFKYLCLQLQKGGYNPLKTNSMVLADMKKKICDDNNWKISYATKQDCDVLFTSQVDQKLENDYALSINFTAAAIAVINCTSENKGKSADCEDTRIKEDLTKADGHGEVSQANNAELKKKRQDELTVLKKMDKCTADETLQLVASMFLAILHNSTKEGESSIFIKNLGSIINHKISNCKKVNLNGTISDEQKNIIINYYKNVIDQINKNLNSISTFLLNEENKKNLIYNAEYTTENSVLETATDIYTITRTYNDYFKNNLQHLKYINNFKIMNSEYKKTFTTLPFKLPTEGVEKVKGKGKAAKIEKPLEINIQTMKDVNLS